MDKTVKIVGGFILFGLAAAVGTAIVMAKNGKFDEMIEKIKDKKESCENDSEDIFEKGMCMISKNSDDYKPHDKKSYGREDLKAYPNGKH